MLRLPILFFFFLFNCLALTFVLTLTHTFAEENFLFMLESLPKSIYFLS